MEQNLTKYEIIINWSEEDGSFIAEVPELPGCMSDGRTYDDAIMNVQIVMKEWIETAASLGRPIPKPNTPEQIEDIARSIKIHRELEIAISAPNKAVGRSNVKYDNSRQIFWLTNQENNRGVSSVRDFTGDIVAVQRGNRTTVEEDGRAIYKNTKLGEALIRHHEGVHTIEVRKGALKLEIFNRTTYKYSDADCEFANDLVIRLSGDNKTYSYRTLNEILKKVEEIQHAINRENQKLLTASDEEAQLLVKKITEKENEKREYLEKAQSFIRKYAALRYQPILDPTQEEIKRAKIFDGTLIINGGPGTGKTTSLIQRIKFLTTPSIEDYYTTLSHSQRELLFEQRKSWIFFSPNELLALFLKNSMKSEGLNADSERVKVWNSYKNELIKTYRLVNPETRRPFLFYNKFKGTALLLNEAKSIQNILAGFEKAYLIFQQEKLNRVVEIDTSLFKWKNLGQSIQNYIKRHSVNNSIEELVRLFLNLTENFEAEIKDITDSYVSLINTVASRIQISIQKDVDRNNTVAELLKKWKVESQEIEDEDDEEIEIEQEDFEEIDDNISFDFERELFAKLKSLSRKQALKIFDKNVKLNKRDRQLIEIIPEIIDQNEYKELGQLAFFKKHFERISKGLAANILREIPVIYKKYRREQLSIKSTNWNLLLLEDLIKKDRNSRIHHDEQALLILFVNQVILKIFKTSTSQYNNLNHPYINSYKNHCKPVIGIDEATDYPLIDLLAINSLGHPDISSVTLSGDIMQRMTTEGIVSWSDFLQIVPKSELRDLQISYRQSPSLLSLAKAIYETSTGEQAKYSSFIEQDDAEPPPLMFISRIEDEKLEWIARRIHEIYKAYGDSIPSIAIFLAEESKLEEFADRLGMLDILSDVGIVVKACRNGEVLGDENTVRIFSIKVIKGLEFESVFFHNIDELLQYDLERDLFLKYLYVGLSRATFYLGLTLSNEITSEFSLISDKFDQTGKTWRL